MPNKLTINLTSNETVADIVREMRNGSIYNENGCIYLHEIADRIEAVYRREVEDAIAATVKASAKSASEVYEPHIQPAQVGNAAKMWEALAEIRLLLVRVPLSIKPVIACGIIASKAKSALAAPPRNCDVGTADEQAERYMNFCRKYPKCTGCPCVGHILYHQCEFVWAQMPYEKGDAE